MAKRKSGKRPPPRESRAPSDEPPPEAGVEGGATPPAPIPGSGPRPGEPVAPEARGIPPRQGDPSRRGTAPEILDRSTIAIPLLKILEEEKPAPQAAPAPAPVDFADEAVEPGPELHPVIIDLNLMYPVDGRRGAKERVRALLAEALQATGADPAREGINEPKSRSSEQYLFCRLSGDTIRELVARDADPDHPGAPRPHRKAIHHIWPDFRVKGQINRSISTVKADAAHRSFSALGEGIVWAVIDSGIDGDHPHFRKYENLRLDDSIRHTDFTVFGAAPGDPLRDAYGHGTHVAGIIAGGQDASREAPILVSRRRRDEEGEVQADRAKLTEPITGMAPKCKLLSLKVLDDRGDGEVSNIIAAIEHIQEINGHGRRIRIHGANLSVGYDFEPEWFACGQSPLCVEVDRLVRSGVVVVVAAGNSGYGQILPGAPGRVQSAGLGLTINDPGNADLAITVGSTHRESPHTYGVSYFSSKGPTGDGRYKPDLVAPGENIISCRSSAEEPTSAEQYKEKSGTSQAAPHVSGAIAAFLSSRREFIGRPEEVKRIFLASATDLNRTPFFQGKGLVDLMRAIQSV